MMKNKVTAYDIPTFDCRSMAIAGGTDVTTVLHKFIIFFCITGIYIYKTMVLFLTLLIIFHIFFFCVFISQHKCSNSVPFDDVCTNWRKFEYKHENVTKLLFYVITCFCMEHFFFLFIEIIRMWSFILRRLRFKN